MSQDKKVPAFYEAYQLPGNTPRIQIFIMVPLENYPIHLPAPYQWLKNFWFTRCLN